ncbi:hypothetical protein C8E00_101462 [Chromohalobacter marismortui]|uniref:Uncharacterized protein n=1 Tax=Chromohalobacter marismortui TaxID=42055 RepID=A0A4R7NX18_9GAMM|nr:MULTISPECIES: hypothetical protein [Chromohalobacter]MCI0510354.1 hypothetical protein [Chromohalobacter sp.]MCI0594761.1 hypothetical protein [Chromohalobacter sp.]TDU25070.1 hypothetical protein C8E00_101462 [Chromohalobacter marismortui]
MRWSHWSCSVFLSLCLGLSSGHAMAAGPALSPGMVQALESLQQRMQEGASQDDIARAKAAARRLQGGNAADRWARALFLQLAATGEAQRGRNAAAADLYYQARRIDGVGSDSRRRWLNQEARLRLRAGQIAQGAELLGAWIDRYGGDSDDLWLMAQAQASLRHWSQAADWVDRARRAGGLNADRRRLAASVYQHAERYDAALALLDAQLEGDSDDPQAWRRAAALAQRMQQPGLAAALWEAGWRRGVLEGEDALERLIRLHLAGGTPARAAEYLERALADGSLPRDSQHQRLLAEAWTAARAHRKALSAWRTLAEDTQAAEDWRQLGELAYGWGEWSTAIEALHRAREQGADAARTWLLEGVSQLELSNEQAAREAFEAARDAGASQAKAWLASLGNANGLKEAPEADASSHATTPPGVAR